MTDSPEQRIAVVTGASRGIGKAIALQLAKQGRHVVAVARNEDLLAALVDEIKAAGGSAEHKTADVGDQASIEAMIESTASDHGRLDILVNNAGITRDMLLLRLSDAEWDDVIQTNLRSVFVATRAALRPMMRKKWGRIINVSSVSALVGNAGQSNYAAAKAGVIAFTKSVAKEMGGKNVTANAVCPGFIETDMTDVLPEAIKENVKKITALGRFGKPDDIAHAVAYIASEGAGYVTGQVLTVDGGMTMS
ncbi:MAG: 3-oxoacyl-[acyl-carrier-protein] reductase [Planctomycetota bacterium]